jgi:hypothetical protein
MKTKNILKSLTGSMLFACALLNSSNQAFAQACDANHVNMQNISIISCTGYHHDSGGSGGNYANNESYLCNITPSSATSITLKFTSFSTELNFDYLRVYDNINGTGTLLATLTGTSLPSAITSTTGKMSLKFTSDGSVVSSGWDAIWTTVGGVCGSVYNMPSVSTIQSRGTLNDTGSPTGDYANNENRLFNITPTDATTICIRFSTFSTESGYDFLKIYDDINATGTLLATLSGTSLPSDVTSTTGKMSLKFTSDGSVVSSGWTAIWRSDGTSRIITSADPEEALADNKIHLFPNPANDKVNIAFNIAEEGQAKVLLYNVAGMETLVLDKTLASGKHTIDFDTSELAPGIYFCKVITGNSILVEKLIKN